MKRKKVFLTGEELVNAKTTAKVLPELMDIFYSIVRLSALTDRGQLPSVSQDELRMFNLFLKNILSDLRSIQVLVSIGYPASAATIASSLWEKSIMGRYLLKEPEKRIKRYLAHGTKKSLLWSMKNMVEDIAVETKDLSSKQAAEFCYMQYAFLCSLKHPQADTIDAVNSIHFNPKRPNELVPGEVKQTMGLMHLVMTQSLYSTLQYLNYTFPKYCCKELVDGTLYLSGQLGKYCFSEKGNQAIPEKLKIASSDLDPSVIDALNKFYGN